MIYTILAWTIAGVAALFLLTVAYGIAMSTAHELHRASEEETARRIKEMYGDEDSDEEEDEE